MSPESSTDWALNQAALQVLAGYSTRYLPTRLEARRSGGGFSGAEIWQVEAIAGMFALRATPAERVNLNRLSGLHRLLTHVHERGITPVAAPIGRLDGTTHTVAEGWVWQLEPWMPGSADFHSRPTALRLQNALGLLARFHRAAQTFVPCEREAIWFGSAECWPSPGIGERRGRIADWDAERCARVAEKLARGDWPAFDALGWKILDLYRKAASRVADELEIARRMKVPLQPCLRDIWHDHVLFTGEEVTGLIDAHACRVDNVATDLARLLGSLVGDERAAWETGLSAYEQIRPLSVAERGLLVLFDRSAVLLSGLTWLEWKYLEGRRFENLNAVLTRLEGIVCRMERIAAE